MPSFFDLQKFAHTGTASPDMTAFDKARALSLFGGGKTQTMTGVPPLSFRANGKPLISWSMLGNGQQNGTPTPSAPIMPTFCGVRTANLVEGYIPRCNINATGELIINSEFNMFYAKVEQGKTYCADVTLLGGYYTTIPAVGKTSYDGQRLGFVQSPFTAPITGYLAFRKASDIMTAMMNEGQTLQNYEPYGWAEKITNAGQTVPVYLGQVQTVRRVRKLVFNGNESISPYDTVYKRFFTTISDMKSEGVRLTQLFSTHYQCIYDGRSIGNVPNNSVYTGGGADSQRLFIKTEDFTDLDSFKAYLDAQYAAGTPVTVWYVLATPTTAIINEPLAKIGDYADELNSTDAGVTIPTVKGQNTLSVDTELPPSEISITGHIKEV